MAIKSGSMEEGLTITILKNSTRHLQFVNITTWMYDNL